MKKIEKRGIETNLCKMWRGFMWCIGQCWEKYRHT